MASTRYEYVDIAKGLGILAVVWAHIMTSGFSHELCYAFHMPLFFLLSGMLFKREKYASLLGFVKHRSKRLFVPYLAYSLTTWVIWVVFRMLHGDTVVSWWMPLLQTVIAKGSGAYLVHNSALWFIPCLFAVELMWFFVGKLNDWIAIVLSLLIGGGSFLLGDFLGDDWWFLLPWNLDAAFIALPFYGVGNLFAKRLQQEKIVSYIGVHKWGTMFIWILFTVLLIIGTLRYDTCSMGSSLYGCRGIVFFLRAFIGCAAMLCLALLLDNIGKSILWYQKLIIGFKWWGRNSLDVMCTHIPIKGVFVLVVAAFIKVSSNVVSTTFWMSMIVFLATLIAVGAVVVLVNSFIRKKK